MSGLNAASGAAGAAGAAAGAGAAGAAGARAGGLGSMLSAGGASQGLARAGNIAGQAGNALGGIGMSFMGAQNQDGLADPRAGQETAVGVSQATEQLGGQLMSSGNPIAMGIGAGVKVASDATQGVVDMQRRFQWEPEDVAQITAGMYEEAENPEFDDEQFVSRKEYTMGGLKDAGRILTGDIGGIFSSIGRVKQWRNQKEQREKYERQYAERQRQAHEHNQAVRNTQRERDENREMLSMIGMPMMGTL